MQPLDPVDRTPREAPGSWSTGDRLRVASDWFATADVLGDELVPAVADWCAVHVRAPLMEALRAGVGASLLELGLAAPVDGEPLEMITLRHREADREPVVRQWAAEVPVCVGDTYGAGRVTATGVTRYLPEIPPTMLQAVITTPAQRAEFARLGIGSSIVVALDTTTGARLGAMTVLRELAGRQAFTEQDVQAAERFARIAADALDSSRIATVAARALTHDAGFRRAALWRPPRPHDPTTSSEGRHWARRTLPELVTEPPRPELYDDMDLVFTELISNAIRHGGGLREAQLLNTGEHLRLIAADNDPRGPAVRARRIDRPNGRGMHLVEAMAERWGVHRHHAEVGKRVWADLRLTT
jgi:hypothetical protein